ncbi:hypothetical protein BDN70DRAFT_811151 [Pholiota conissans]|uniref:Uncharacterized protein n=1 Tax=Pholiota conissans TaxID=109636 RepID=A0A9P5YWS1_9AGAR|nr:hypothetical protein BDN70DRAFT_811151 [Pholiota conissans]
MSDNTLSTTPLALWLQTRFSELYESVPPPEEADFKALFYSTFADNAWIYLNHEKMNEDKYLARFNSYNFAIKHAEVDWKELVDASASGSGSTNKVSRDLGSKRPSPFTDPPIQGGIVSGFFVVHRYMKFRIRASAAERLSYNTFSAKIEVKPNASPASDGSRLRITELMITTVDKAAPIHFPGIHRTS